MQWRYAATDLRTGRVLADTVPLIVQSWTRVRGGTGPMTAALPLTGDPTYLNMLKPRSTVIWALGDGQPYWGGILWGRPHRSALSDQTLPLSLSSVESIFDKRRINDNLGYTNLDQIEIFRRVVTYALGKKYGEVGGFTMDTAATSGVLRSRTYLGTDHTNVLNALQDLADVDNGFEWTIDPAWINGTSLGWQLRFGYPQIGNDSTTNLVMNFPGVVVDYAWPQDGSASVNSTLAVGDTPTGGATQMISGAGHGVDTADLDAGMPLLEDTRSYGGQGITDVATLNSHADQDVAVESGDTVNPSLVLRNDFEPRLGRYSLGDTVMVNAVSNIHPAPGLQVATRIAQITANPATDGTSPEKVTLTMDAITDVEV